MLFSGSRNYPIVNLKSKKYSWYQDYSIYSMGVGMLVSLNGYRILYMILTICIAQMSSFRAIAIFTFVRVV